MNSNALHEIETEKSLIGFLLLRGAGADRDFGIVGDDFYVELHKRLFDGILELIDLGSEIDPITLLNYLKENGRLKDETKETDYILGLYRDTVTTQPLSYYTSRVKRLSDRRKYFKALLSATETLTSEPGENEAVFSAIEQTLMDISRIEKSRGLRSVREDFQTLVEYIESVFKNKGAMVSGLRTHYKEFDELTTGLKPHELVILAARPGNGKTTLALNIAANVALKENKPVVIFSMEMSRQELLIKMIASEARIDSRELKTGSILDNQKVALLSAIQRITTAPIYIDDSGYLTIQEFNARIRKLLTMEREIGIIVVDYLQLMNDPKSSQGGRQLEVSSISRSLKAMAKEAQSPVLALSQLSRQVENRTKDQKPQLSDLRESGAIEQDADIVCFIYREELVKKDEIDPELKGKAEIIVAKNRAGAMGSFHLLFTPQYSRFDNLAVPIATKY